MRQVYSTVAMIGLVLVLIAGLSSCATTPDRDDTLRTIDLQMDALLKWYLEEIARCQGEPACEQLVRETYITLREEAWRLRLEVINEDWQDARERRKALEDKLRDLIPTFPDLRDLLEPLLDYPKSNADAGEGWMTATPDSTPSSAMSAMATPQPTTYTLGGLFTLYDGGLGDPTFGLSGTLEVSGAPVAPGQTRVFSAGTITVTFSIDQVDFTIHEPVPGGGLESWIQTDATGEGWISLVLDFDEETVLEGSWGAIFSSPTIIRLPVTIDENDVIRFEMSYGVIADLFPYKPWAPSDYDRNGWLNPDEDSTAFLVGFQAQELLADSDGDGTWTQVDIDLWWDRFWDDYANQ
jgi:hypothetical protein